jgi:outer membrane protein assembly factor BamB
VAQGRIYTIDSTGAVAATTTAGAKAWSADLKPAGARSTLSGGGLAYGDGMVFATSGYAELVALDPASGKVIWRQNLGAPATGAPTVDGGQVYVTGRDGTAWAIRAKDGKVAWQFTGTPSPSGMMGAASPAIAGNSVIFAFGSTEVLSAQKTDGAPEWRTSVAGKRLGRGYGAVTDITGDPVIVGKVTYIGNQSGRSAAIETTTGARLWTADDAAYGPMLPVGGSVFLLNDEAKLVRLDADTGAKIWAVDLPYYTKTREKSRAKITANFGPSLAGGHLIVASGDGALRLFNPEDGSVAGTVDLPGGAAAAPAFAGGAMYIVSANGQLHAFR